MAFGLHLHIEHAGLNASSVLLADVVDGTDSALGIKPGPVYVPAGGAVDLLYAGSVIISFESGSVRQFLDAGYITATFRHGTESYVDRAPIRFSPANYTPNLVAPATDTDQLLAHLKGVDDALAIGAGFPSGAVIVAKSGGDYNTITEGLAAASPGDVVVVYPGTYAESVTIPTGVRLIGFPDSQNVVISGADATSTRVTMNPTTTLREISVIGPSSGANPAIDATALTGPADLGVLFTVVVRGGGGAGNAISAGTGGTLLAREVFHNGGSFGGNLIETIGTDIVVAGGVANAGVVGGAYFYANGGLVHFDEPYTIRPTITSAAEAVRVGANSSVEGFFRIDTGTNIATGLRISGDDAVINLTASVLRAQTNDILIDTGLTGEGSTVILSSCEIRQERVTNLSPTFFSNLDVNVVNYTDIGGIDDASFQIGGELEVGSPFAPARALLGEGGSTSQSMVVKRDDGTGTNFDDITTILTSPTGSSAQVLQGVAAGNTCYIGSLISRFPGTQQEIVTPTDDTTGSWVWEYSDGTGGWVPFNIMCREDSGTGTSFGQRSFCSINSTKTNYGDLASNTEWLPQEVDGVTAYWVRWRVVTDIVTAPTLERLRLQASTMQIDNTGIQRHGTNRPSKPLLVHQRLTEDLAGANPGNGSFDVGTDLEVTLLDNQFNNSVDDGFGGFLTIPRGLDTSSPVRFEVGWVPDSNNTGNLNLNLLIAEDIELGTDIDSGSVPVTTYSTPDTRQPSGNVIAGAKPEVEADTQGQIYLTTFTVDLPNALPTNFIAYALRRDDGSAPTDTFNGRVKVAFIKAEGRFWQS